MKKLPTDRQVLRTIFDEYEHLYPGNNFEDGVPGPNDPHIAIDILTIARKLGCQAELLHGILYFHMNEIYGYETRPNVFVKLFEKSVASKPHCVNFPYLASKLAALEEEHSRVQITRILSILALIISGVALGAKMFSI